MNVTASIVVYKSERKTMLILLKLPEAWIKLKQKTNYNSPRGQMSVTALAFYHCHKLKAK